MTTLQDNFDAATSQLLLALVEEEEGGVVSKKRLPNPVTVPKKGPLILKTTASSHLPGRVATAQHVPNAHGRRIFTNPKYQQRPLTKYPVLMVQRPIEQIESELGELSCAQLRDSIQLITVSSCEVVNQLPTSLTYKFFFSLHCKCIVATC